MNNSTILTIKNGELSGYYFCMNLNIWKDFQICISVPLKIRVTSSSYPSCFFFIVNFKKIKIRITK